MSWLERLIASRRRADVPNLKGWRVWHVDLEHAMLLPVMMWHEFPECWDGPHAAASNTPSEICMDGLWCLRPEHFATAVAQYNYAVYGRIHCYGSVVLYEYGYRASHALVERLVLRPTCSVLTSMLHGSQNVRSQLMRAFPAPPPLESVVTLQDASPAARTMFAERLAQRYDCECTVEDSTVPFTFPDD